jgi:hypothetical protein
VSLVYEYCERSTHSDSDLARGVPTRHTAYIDLRLHSPSEFVSISASPDRPCLYSGRRVKASVLRKATRQAFKLRILFYWARVWLCRCNGVTSSSR